MKTTRRNFLKGLGTTLASLWCIGATRPKKTPQTETESTEKITFEAKTPVDPSPEVAQRWEQESQQEKGYEDSPYFLGWRSSFGTYPSSCKLCARYLCDPKCPNYKECGIDEPCSPDCPIVPEHRKQYRHCPYKPFEGLDKIIKTGYIDSTKRLIEEVAENPPEIKPFCSLECDDCAIKSNGFEGCPYARKEGERVYFDETGKPVSCEACDSSCPHWETREKDCHDIATGVPQAWPISCSECKISFAIETCPDDCPHKHADTNVARENLPETWFTTESPRLWHVANAREAYLGDVERIETPDPDKPGQFVTVGEIRNLGVWEFILDDDEKQAL